MNSVNMRCAVPDSLYIVFFQKLGHNAFNWPINQSSLLINLPYLFPNHFSFPVHSSFSSSQTCLWNDVGDVDCYSEKSLWYPHAYNFFIYDSETFDLTQFHKLVSACAPQGIHLYICSNPSGVSSKILQYDMNFVKTQTADIFPPPSGLYRSPCAPPVSFGSQRYAKIIL